MKKMNDQHKDKHKPSSDPYEKLLEHNEHLKWPLIILVIIIILLVILADIAAPNT